MCPPINERLLLQMSSDGLLRMFGEEGLKKISTDPLLIPYLSDPLFLEMVDDISVHPEHILKWQSNPKLERALMIILPMMRERERQHVLQKRKLRNGDRALQQRDQA